MLVISNFISFVYQNIKLRSFKTICNSGVQYYDFCLISTIFMAQTGELKGHLSAEHQHLPFANIHLKNTEIGTTSDNWEITICKICNQATIQL